VRYYRSGVQPFHHPAVGDLDLDFDALEVPTDPGLTILVYTAASGSDAARTLALLGDWTTAGPDLDHEITGVADSSNQTDPS
jgi:hypothetical protein